MAPARADVVVAFAGRLQADIPPVDPGDRFQLAVLPGGGQIALSDVVDWRLLELRELPRGPVRVVGLHAGSAHEWTLTEGAYQFKFERPAGSSLGADTADLEAAVADRDIDRAQALLDRMLPVASASSRPLAVAYMELARAKCQLVATPVRSKDALDGLTAALLGTDDPMMRAALLDQALQAALIERLPRESIVPIAEEALALLRDNAPQSLALSTVHFRLAQEAAQRGAHDEALKQVAEAISLRRAQPHLGMQLAEALFMQSAIFGLQERNAEGLAAVRESVDIGLAVAPESQQVARWMAQVSNLERLVGEVDAAERSALAAVEMLERSKANPVFRAEGLQALGNAQTIRGDLSGAEATYRENLRLILEVDPRETGFVHHNLGVTALARGDLETAEFELAQAVEVKKSLNPRSLTLARSLHSLARTRALLGDEAEAAALLQEAGAMAKEMNPDGQMYSDIQVALAQLLRSQGKLADAETALERATAGVTQFAPDSHFRIPLLREKAALRTTQRRAPESLALLEEAAAIARKHAARSVQLALVQQELGSAMLELGRTQDAQAVLQEARKLQEELAPDSLDLAHTWSLLARADALSGNAARATERHCKAADLLDRVRLPLGDDSHARSRFRARFVGVYQACLDGLLAAGRPADAFAVLERMRGRAFLDSVQARDLTLAGDVDADAYRWLALQRRIGDGKGKPEETAQLKLQQQRLERRLADGTAHLLPALLPQVLPLGELQAFIPTHAVALSYAVMPERSWIFRIDHEGLKVHAVPVGSARLAEDIARFRRLIAARNPDDLPALREMGATLYAQWVEPALRGAEPRPAQLYFAPDGALHDLPFAALYDAAAQRWLIEEFDIALIDSLSNEVLAAERATSDTGGFLGVADPAVRPELPPLPGARDEVRDAARRFGGEAHVLVGPEATESRALSLAGRAKDIHFAVHATLDADNPLESALELSPAAVASPADDGRLQLREVLEDWQLGARLVVLSGCDTAAGPLYGGEGLFGFARGFRFAGAGRVLATLWPIQDRATVRLMDSFYGSRQAGADEPAALRQATLFLLGTKTGMDSTLRGVGALRPHHGSSAAVHPFDWAGFQVYGMRPPAR